MACPGRPSGPKGRRREGPRAPVGGSVTAASEKWALKCVSGLLGWEAARERGREEGGRKSLKSHGWVVCVWRRREEERKGRKERL